VSYSDLDDLRLLFAHAHQPKKIGIFRNAVLDLRSKFSRQITRPAPLPLPAANKVKDKKAA
jgi:hypothetical protein